MLLLDERPPAKAGSWARDSAPTGWDVGRTAADAPWEAPVGAEPQKPARKTAPSATSAGRFDEVLLFIDERPPAKAGSWARDSAPTGWDVGRTVEDAPWGASAGAVLQKPARCPAPSAPRSAAGFDSKLLCDVKPPATAGGPKRLPAPCTGGGPNSPGDCWADPRRWVGMECGQPDAVACAGDVKMSPRAGGGSPCRAPCSRSCPSLAAYCIVLRLSHTPTR